MLRVWVCATHMVGVWVQNSLNKGPCFGRFSLNMGGFSRNWQKLPKIGSFPPKFIMKEGIMATVGN